MNDQTRQFPTAVVASISTGILLCSKFAEMQEAAEYLMGRPIWTHQFADKKLCDEMKQIILEQCPDMPTEIQGVTSDNYLEKLAEIEAKIGKAVTIKNGKE